MSHFLEISQFTQKQIEQLLHRAFAFKKGSPFCSFPAVKMVNLFYEPSTRTRMSFELAARNLDISVMTLDLSHSSESKGEILEDTVKNLVAMGVNLLVVRHAKEGVPAHLAKIVQAKAHIINAGDGTYAHPSQAMIDLMTILEHKPKLSELKIAIVGNLRHSRVANSLQCLFKTMGVKELVLVAPPVWQPSSLHFGRVTDSLQEGLEGSDVVICLRVQEERLSEESRMDITEYKRQFSLTKDRLRLAKSDAIVMHPGPVNRGVEMDSEVVDSPCSVILQQVSNGVFMRSAILEFLVSD